MKRTQLKRGSSPLRGKRLARKPMKLARRKPTDDPAQLRKVERLPCAATGMPGHHCRGRVIAHHSLTHRRGQLRALDRNTIPLAWGCHEDFHASPACGPFEGMGKAERRAWERKKVAETQAATGWKAAA